MEKSRQPLRLLSGNGNLPLAQGIAQQLGITLEPCEIGRFADGEINIHIKNNVRGSDIFLIQPTCPPHVNDMVMELLLLTHTLKLASPCRITLVVPYFGYARQDRKVKPRVPISASAVAQLIEAMGPHRILAVDLHSGQLQGFFTRAVDNLFVDSLFVSRILAENVPPKDLVIVSPDAGGVTRAHRIADRLCASGVVTILKRRMEANKVTVDSMHIVGDVVDKTCVIVDDMIDTAGTLQQAAKILKGNRASRVIACASHGVFSGPAITRINECEDLQSVIVTDSISQENNLRLCPKLSVVSLVPLLAEAIARLHQDESLSTLFGSAPAHT